MTAPWGNPPPPDRRGIKDFIGRSVLIVIGGVRFGVAGQRGPYDVVHTTLVSLAGADAGVIYNDVHIFTSRIVGRLRACTPGDVKLAKVVDAGKAPDLDDPDSWDQEAARAWFMGNPGLLDHLKVQAVNDYHDFVNRPPVQPNGPVQQQPTMAAQQQYAQQMYAQPAPQYAQPQYTQQPQYQAPQVQPVQQPAYATTTTPPLPPSQQYGPPPGPDAPPAAPPPQSYQPQQNATLASMGAQPAPQNDQPPF